MNKYMYNLNRRRFTLSELESLKMNVLVTATFFMLFSGTCQVRVKMRVEKDAIDEILKKVKNTDGGDHKSPITDAKEKPLGQSFISGKKNYEIEKPFNENVCLLASMDTKKVMTTKDICYTRDPVNVDFLDEQIKKACEGRKIYIMKETPCKKLPNHRRCKLSIKKKVIQGTFRYCRKFIGSKCIQISKRTFQISFNIDVYKC